jgi:hypothetical protein
MVENVFLLCHMGAPSFGGTMLPAI